MTSVPEAETELPTADDPARAAMLAAQRGDRAAFGTLVAMFAERVMRLLTTILHCDRATAEDLGQEVFLRVHKGLPDFDGKVRFATWLYAIARNVAISAHRSRRAQKRRAVVQSLDAPLGPDDDRLPQVAGRELDPAVAAGQQEFLGRVRAAVQELPDEFREAVVLRDMEGLAYEEIAMVLELPTGTVRSRIHRGRLWLAGRLQEFAP
ncbi:MAG: sigma-70 family RNA polymerase sigma factor [Planctomycetes bacterium]|nr:sigma-70 family RNA polymerase sigma factor [Planctomycetota bacterium]